MRTEPVFGIGRKPAIEARHVVIGQILLLAMGKRYRVSYATPRRGRIVITAHWAERKDWMDEDVVHLDCRLNQLIAVEVSNG